MENTDMSRTILTITFGIILTTCVGATGEDNPAVREYLGQAAKKALAKHDSEGTAWYSEKTKKETLWAEKKVFGKTIKTKIGSVTHEAKTWLWLDDPNRKLNVTVTKFEIKGDIVHFGVTASGKAKGKASGRIPKIVKADVKMSANVKITIEGTAKVTGRQFTDVEIAKLTGTLSDLRFNNDALKQVQGLVKDCANWYIRHKNDDLKKDMKKSIEGFRW
jgi:hypothetical protein